MKRLFVAFDPDEPVRNSLAAEVTRFRRELGEREELVRWVPPERYHITAVFLGDTAEEELPRLKDALTRLLLPDSPTVTLGTATVFPTPRSPRVLVRGLGAGRDTLSRITAALRASLQAEGFAFDTKPFRPHLTVGYLRKRRLSELRAVAEAWIRRNAAGEPAGAISGAITALTLYESELRGEGAVHTALLRRPLG